jgi:hypothetical protein
LFEIADDVYAAGNDALTLRSTDVQSGKSVRMQAECERLTTFFPEQTIREKGARGVELKNSKSNPNLEINGVDRWIVGLAERRRT